MKHYVAQFEWVDEEGIRQLGHFSESLEDPSDRTLIEEQIRYSLGLKNWLIRVNQVDVFDSLDALSEYLNHLGQQSMDV